MAEEIERIYIIPLKKKGFKTSRSAPTAVKRVKNYLIKHMKVEEKNIWIDDSLNDALWSKGKYNSPSRVRVKAVKFDDGVVEAYLPELEFKKSRREILKEEREKKEPILRREEMMPEEREAGEVPGAEDYDIAPSADGEVKIKKKKPAKEKEEEKPEEKKKEERKEKTKKEEKEKKVKKQKKPKKEKPKKSKKKTASKSKKSSKKEKSKNEKKKKSSSKKSKSKSASKSDKK